MRWLSILPLRLRSLFRRRRVEQDLHDELQFHVDALTARHIARGLMPDDARRAAQREMYGTEGLKERCRDARRVGWIEDLVRDGRYALRTMCRRPGFAVVAVATMALGSGATTLMFTVVNSVLLKPLASVEPEKVVTLRGHREGYNAAWGFSYPDFLDAQRQSRSLTLAAWKSGGGTVSQPGEAAYVSGSDISSDLFAVLGFRIAAGRVFTAEDDRPGAAPVAIISERLARERYGSSQQAIGAPLVFDDKPYTVVGVAPPGFLNDDDVFTPLGQDTEPRMASREARFLHVVARLQPSVTLAEGRSELALIGQRLAAEYPSADAGRGIVVRPLQQELVANVRSTLWLLFAAVGLVLLIACANLASLLLARAVSRERELATRVALGAGRGRLVRQCLTESALLAGFGGLLGIGIATMGLRPFVALWPDTLPRAAEVAVDSRVLALSVIVSVLCGLLFGMLPALRVPAGEVEHTLRADARTVAGGSRRVHGGFVTMEIALAMILLAAAGMLGRTLLRLSSTDPGVNLRNVVVARVALPQAAINDGTRTRAVWQDALNRGRQAPGVQQMALADIIPMRAGENAVGYWTSPDMPSPNQLPITLASTVTPDYLKVMGIPLQAGRFFTDQDRLDSPAVAVIDEVLAHHAFGAQPAVGKRLWIQGLGPVQVLGVVGHVRHWGLATDDHAEIRDQMYLPFAQLPDRFLRIFSTFMSVAVRTTGAPLGVVEPLRRSLRAGAGDLVLYEVRTMEQLASASLARQSFLMWLFGVFAVLALVLACVGLYGVLAYVTNQRVAELGVRMALGATAGDIVGLVLRQGARMILPGVGVGLFGAWASGRLMMYIVDGMPPPDAVAIAVMAFVLLVAALLASLIPARRATRIDTVQTLRQD